MWLWHWHFYHSCLHIDGRIKFWILTNLSLTLRDTLESTPKVNSNKNYSVGFSHDAELSYKRWIQKVNLSGAILCKRQKEPQGFQLQLGSGGTPPISKKVTNSPPMRVPHTKYLHSTHERRTTPYYYLKLEIKIWKPKKLIKIFKKKIS